jgi:hypothetical protein
MAVSGVHAACHPGDSPRTGEKSHDPALVSAILRLFAEKEEWVAGPFWLIPRRHAILGGFHRRPSVTEQSVEGPDLSGRPTQEDEARPLRVSGFLSRPGPSAPGAFVVSGLPAVYPPQGGMYGQG